MTNRQDILENLKTAIETVAGMKAVDVNKIDTRDLQDTPLPASWIFSGSETRAEFIYKREHWSWDVIIQVWARDTDMEDLLDKVNTAIYAMYQALYVNVDGAIVTNLYRDTSDLYEVDSDESLKGWVITYKIFYNTDKGTI
jgi:hypothetical protein